ncbi:hypothetical protein [Comamonas thiooxydans]|uniref:hypothetical protein n=2 Tax=Comamonadaceae TaxID=80864 RepID=UPI00062177B4|nr:hypothetical protein [Comamonas thiooxydans]KKI12218.1 hypothetical protein XA67_20670 [Comamonas thiooxydans]UBQ44454.1 hypothetical protein LCH15_25630 [Comamonas thiooxydans]
MVRLLGLWVCAMAWHLFRLITLRPVFALMADSVVTVSSFSLVFFVAGWSRLYLSSSADWPSMHINLVLFYLCIVICLERRTRSSSLVCAALGFSAAVDVLMLGLYASGAISGLNPGARLMVLKVLGIGVLRQQFLRCPPEVQANGYRRSNAR